VPYWGEAIRGVLGMMNNDQFSRYTNSEQFVISYELLALLQWFVEHDAEKLKKIIAKALDAGLIDKLQHSEDDCIAHEPIEDMQGNIIEFFSLLEALIAETIHEQAVQNAVEKNLMPAIDHLDSSVCDNATVRFSIEKATSRLKKSPQENPQEILFQEILRRWKPSKKKILN
jgi:hypothetical protein